MKIKNSLANKRNLKNFILNNFNLLILFSELGLYLFIIFVIISMILYPDGAVPLGEISSHYNFWWNYLSDLGMTKSFLGNPKIGSTIFFILSIISLSFSGTILNLMNLINIWSILNLKFSSEFISNGKIRNSKFKILYASISGIFSSVFAILIAIFPKDTNLYEHQIIAGLFFLGISIQIFLYSTLLFLIKRIIGKILLKKLNINYNQINYKFNILGMFISSVLFLVVLGLYSILPILIPELGKISSPFEPIMQKISIIILIINIYLQIRLNKNYKLLN